MKMRPIPIQCVCVQPGVTGESGEGMEKLPGGHNENKDAGMDVGLPC